MAGDAVSRKSTTGYLWSWHGNLVSWSSQRQKTTALSSAEAELISIVEALRELKWLLTATTDISLADIPDERPAILNTDSQSALAITERSNTVRRVRHMDIRFHFTRDLIDEGNLAILYVPTALQTADILTKALDRQLFERHRQRLQLSCPSVDGRKQGSSL